MGSDRLTGTRAAAPQRIAIINTVACNGGDAAILAAIAAQLRDAWPTCLLTAYDTQPDTAAQYHPWIRFDAAEYWAAAKSTFPWPRRTRWLIAAWLRGRGMRRAAARIADAADRRRLARLGRADLVISTGGTYLVDTYRLTPRFFEFLAVRLLRRPYLLHTQTMGPFRKRFNRAGMRGVLRSAAAVFVRDRGSRDTALSLGAAPSRVAIAPDVVFGMAHDDAPARLRQARIGGSPRVCVSVRDIAPFVRRSPHSAARYEQAVAELVAFLVRERGASVDFLSSCQGIPEYRYDDAVVGARVRDLLPSGIASSVRVLAGQHTPAELTERFADYDVVIATRMHVAILALGAGTPVLPVPYERKIDELFRDLAAPFTIVSAAHASGSALVASWRELERALPEWRAEVARCVAEWRTAAWQPQHRITALLAARAAEPDAAAAVEPGATSAVKPGATSAVEPGATSAVKPGKGPAEAGRAPATESGARSAPGLSPPPPPPAASSPPHGRGSRT